MADHDQGFARVGQGAFDHRGGAQSAVSVVGRVMPKVFKRLDAIRVKQASLPRYAGSSSSRLRMARSTCCRPVTASVRQRRSRSRRMHQGAHRRRLPWCASSLQLDPVLHPVFVKAAEATGKRITVSLPASPSATATGRIVFNAATAEQWARMATEVILCRIETSPRISAA